MNAITGTQLTDEQIDAIRAEAKRVVAEHYPSQAAAARDAGIAESTFAALLAGTYAGKMETQIPKLQAWLASRAERAKTAATLPKAPAFQLLPSSQKILSALTWAQVAPAFVPIIGAPGVSKTTTSEHYQATNPNVWMVTVTPSTASASALLAEICVTMDIDERSTTRMSRAIGQRVKGGIQGLIIIDEAQNLTVAALEEARALVDRFKVGVGLLGNRSIHAKLYGKGQESHGQLFSRASIKPKLVAPMAGDICQMVAAWGVTEADEIKLLKAIGKKIGALRNLDTVMKLASMLAAGAGQTRSLAHIRAAWEQIDVDLATDTL
jgi:DNA transposition AAA+ family ATPase